MRLGRIQICIYTYVNKYVYVYVCIHMYMFDVELKEWLIKLEKSLPDEVIMCRHIHI
jgi:hypothetical protein